MKVIDITPTLPKKEGKIRLAPYCRVSRNTEDQLNSFAAQIRHYREYTQDNSEYEIVDIYADEGLTGMEMDKRDDFLRLIRDCKKGLVDRIIVKSVSRFARNTIEILETIRELKKCGVSVYFEEQGIDTEKLNMEMIITFPGMAAQQESEAISGNVRWSYQKRMQSGEFNCCTPAYGYRLIDGEMVINEEEAKVVRRIFELYLGGKGLQAIAGLFNEEHVPRRYGRTHWHHNTIRYILTNERYKGDALLQKKYTTDTLPYRLKLNKGEKTQYYVENSNVAIISREIFDRAQELLKLRKNEEHMRMANVLSGMIRCPDCGGTFRRHEKDGKVYWFCMNTASSTTRCKSRRVKEKMIHKEGAVRPVTMNKYVLALTWLKKLVPELKLKDLDRIAYQKLLNEYAKHHERQTTMDFHHQLKGAILDAVDEGLIARDPTRKTIIKGKTPRAKKPKYLSQFELHTLLKHLDLSSDVSWDWLILLVAKTGMRFSEALAITPKDFDFSHQSLSIDKTWDYKGKGGFLPTKNKTSIRKIQIDWQTVVQFSELVKGKPEDKPLFIKCKVYNSTVNDLLKRKCKEANIPIISIHGLRHTHASLLLFAGVSIASVAKRLGHASMTTTQKTYLHIIHELENKDIDLVMRAISSL